MTAAVPGQGSSSDQTGGVLLPTRSSIQRLWAFAVLSGTLLGFSAGMGLDAISGHAPYYMTRQTLMGFLAGFIAPMMALMVARLAPYVMPVPMPSRMRGYRHAMYGIAGFLTGLVCMVIYMNLPAPPVPVGASVIIYPIAATLVFVPVATFADSYEETSRQERRTRDIFSRYVSSQIVERMLAQSAPVTLSGERRVITVLFSDIRGFSRLSQEMSPDAVVGTLNEYFTLMVDLVFQYGGTIDKFLGDGLMVLFGAPLALGDEAFRAVQAAQAMQRSLADLNAQRATRAQPPLAIGIGIDSGEAVTGNIGSPKRLEYTAIGVVVNNASHLSKLSGPGETLITPSTLSLVQGRVSAEPWRSVVLRGSDVETQIYRVTA